MGNDPTARPPQFSLWQLLQGVTVVALASAYVPLAGAEVLVGMWLAAILFAGVVIVSQIYKHSRPLRIATNAIVSVTVLGLVALVVLRALH